MREITYRYRIYPNEKQQAMIRDICGHARYVYNQLLTERTQHFRETRKWKRMDLDALIDKNAFLQKTDRGALIWAKNSLDRAYRGFFHIERTEMDRYRPESVERSQREPEYRLMDTDLMGYPRFKRKKESTESYTTFLNELTFQNGKVLLPSLGAVKIRYHREIPEDSEIISCSIRKMPSGSYFLLLRLKIREAQKNTGEQTLGVVFTKEPSGVVCSNEMTVLRRQEDPQLEERIRKAYKTLKRRTPGSKRYEAQYRYLSSLQEKRTNQRKDWLHKASRQITNAGDVLYVQQPLIREKIAEIESPEERRELLNQARYTLYSFIRYKTELDGKQFWNVPRGYPAMEICSACGVIAPSLSTEAWKCPICGTELPQELNAARNIQKLAEKHIRERKEV